MEQLIPVINKLQDVFNAVGGEDIDLPQIVVIGSQSSGKSSVLEAIVGRDFLPRGSGIVTRRPLILQLINIKENPNFAPPSMRNNNNNNNNNNSANNSQEFGEFLHKPNEIFHDFARIRQEIQAETDRTTGTRKGISPKPIRLKIYSPYVLNLTLVDLPGMTRVAVGDQPEDIEEQIRKMCLSYIEKPNSIILSVQAANTDIANSDGIRLAKEVDPEGKRTIGVITKIDIMDKGTDALDMLLGRIISLKLGFVGVINRSQQDINNNKTIREALKSETEFFANHPMYRSISNRLGTPYLAKTLNRVLMNHIKNTLPDLKVKINKMISDAQNELMTYGESLFDSKKSQGALLLQIITKFSTNYKDAIDGKLGELSVNELYGGARINYIFTEIYNKCLNNIQPNDGLTLNDIRTAIKNATGPRASLFVPEVSFELLVRRQISRLEEPSLQCVELVYDELQRIVAQLESKELLRFQGLREHVVEVVNNLLLNCKIPTRKMINNLIAIEHAYINTNHEDFVGGGGAISKIFEKMARSQQQEEYQRFQQQQQLQYNQQQQQGNNQPKGNPKPNGPSGNNQQPGGQGNNGFFNKFFGGNQQPGGQGNNNNNNNNNNQRAPMQPMNNNRGNNMGMNNGMNRGNNMNNMSMNKPPQRQQQNHGMGMMGYGDLRNDRLDQVPVTIKASMPNNEKERFETELIQNLLASYFDIVRKNITDSVPKSIMHFLVNTSKDNIQNELVRHLYKEELFDELLEESPITAQRRRHCQELLKVLKRASNVLNEVRDFTPHQL